MEDQLVAAVERLTVRKVRTVLSGSSTPGESAVEVFVLEPDDRQTTQACVVDRPAGRGQPSDLGKA
jgi:hypothetical protein